MFAQTPEPPYYACIFSSQQNNTFLQDYALMAETMLSLVQKQDGFLGAESVRDINGFGITVSYWSSLGSIERWKQNTEHQIAQKRGKKEWYDYYKVRICKVERDTALK